MYKSTWYNDSGPMTRQFICQHLISDHIGRLDTPLAFGDGLTDCTYLEWIRDRARRLFLILTDLGMADRIFGVIDEGWEDDDLPIAIDQVVRLRLVPARDAAKVERAFHERQFFYLARSLERGRHLDYDDHELVPLDVVERRQASGGSLDTVQLPSLPLGEVLTRRRVPLGSGAGFVSEDEFTWEVNSIKDVQHPHMACYWGSYTHQGYGYVLFAPAGEHKLSAFLSSSPPPAIKSLDGALRRRMVVGWIHCMVSTLCFAHDRGIVLGSSIRPSAIALTRDHRVIFTIPSSPWLTPDDAAGVQQQQHGFDREIYNYAAPERFARHAPPPVVSTSSTGGSSRAAGSSRGRVMRSPRQAADDASMSGNRQKSTTAPTLAVPFTPTTENASHQHSRHGNNSNPQAADVFALGCVVLEILGHGLLPKKRSASSFAALRSARHKSAGRGGAVPDTSFHRNLGQVESWTAGLARDAAREAAKHGISSSKKMMAVGGSTWTRGLGGGTVDVERDEKAKLLACVGPLLRVVERMLAASPTDRPSAAQVRAWLTRRVAAEAGLGVGIISEPHCAWAREDLLGGWPGAGGPRAGSGGLGGVEEEDEDEDEEVEVERAEEYYVNDNDLVHVDYDDKYHHHATYSSGAGNFTRSQSRTSHSKTSHVAPSSVDTSDSGGTSFLLDAASPSDGEDSDAEAERWASDVLGQMRATPSRNDSSSVSARGPSNHPGDRDRWRPFGRKTLAMTMSMQNLHIGVKPSRGRIWNSGGRSFNDSVVSASS